MPSGFPPGVRGGGLSRMGVVLLGLLSSGGRVVRAQQATPLPEAPGAGLAPGSGETAAQGESRGSVQGRVTDSNGGAVAGARVVLQMRGSDVSAVKTTAEDGSFAFDEAGGRSYRLSVDAPGFAPASASGVTGPETTHDAITVRLRPQGTTTSVEVRASRADVAAAQVKQAETQRVAGIFPNFYVAYSWDAPPMSTRQKFGMAWKTTSDPISFLLTGGLAGAEQAENTFSGFGQGAAGYGRRYGAAFADQTISTFLSSAVLPTLFRQDPRYFYRGVGSTRSRAVYALESAVMCRSDQGRWEPNYSNVLGNLATGAISNLYYPAVNRNGAVLTFQNGLLGTAGAAAGNLIQEFVLRRVTSHAGGRTGKP